MRGLYAIVYDRRMRWAVASVCALGGACGYDGRAVVDGPAGGDSAGVDAVGDAGTASADATVDAGGCPASYTDLTGAPSKYRVVDRAAAGTTWVGAEQDCRDDGAATHLAIPETQAEHQAFIDVMSGASRWLGVTDRITEDVWLPIIGGDAGWYAAWAGGTPQNQGDCLLLSRIPAHEDMPCADPDPAWHEGFICECDGLAVDPTTF